MNRIHRSCLAVAALAAAGFSSLRSAEPAASAVEASPGYVDFGKLVPSAEGRFVEVNLSEGLLKFAAAIATHQNPQAADMLKNLRRVRVNVIELNDANRAATLERVQDVRHRLAAQGWAQMVNVREGAKGDDVQIFAKTRGEEAIEGLVVTVISPHDGVVLVNVVGDIKPDQIASLADRFDIEPLKHLECGKPKKT